MGDTNAFTQDEPSTPKHAPMRMQVTTYSVLPVANIFF